MSVEGFSEVVGMMAMYTCQIGPIDTVPLALESIRYGMRRDKGERSRGILHTI